MADPNLAALASSTIPPGSPASVLINEFVSHPSFRAVASFFLGFVFITCIHYCIHVLLYLFTRLRLFLIGRRHSALPLIGHSALERGLNTNPYQTQPYPTEKVNHWLSSNPHFTNSPPFSPTSISSSSSWAIRPFSSNLALALTICFGMSSLAHFGTLLVFEKSQLGGCAFLVAWSGLAGQAARLLGLVRLSLDLRRMGARKWEAWGFWGMIFAVMVITFVNNGVSIGTFVTTPGGPILCFQDRNLGLALVQSLIDIVLEIYALVRLLTLMVPSFLSMRHKIEAAWDVRVFRALTLLILDIATIVPAAKFYGILVDTIPGSLATLLVLAAFNHRSPEVGVAPTATIPSSERHESMIRSPDTILNIKSPSVPSIRSAQYAASRISHPFSASALQDPAPETEFWPASAVTNPAIPEPVAVVSPRSPRSPRKSRYSRRVRESTDSEIARSVKGAVVGFAFKDMVGPKRKSRMDRQFTPMVGTPVTLKAAELRAPSPAAQGGSPQLTVKKAESAGSSSSSLGPSPNPSLIVSTPTPSTKATKSSGGSSSSSGGTTTRSASNASSFHLTPSTPLQRGLSVLTSVTLHTDRDGNDWPYDGMSSPRRDSQISESGLSTLPSPTRLPPVDDDLSIVYEESEPPLTIVARRPTTFGESMLVGLSQSEGYAYRGPPEGVPEDINGSGSGSSQSK